MFCRSFSKCYFLRAMRSILCVVLENAVRSPTRPLAGEALSKAGHHPAGVAIGYYHNSRVEPRVFEPLSSAVQERLNTIGVVRQCLKMPANERIFLTAYHGSSPLFARVGVNNLHSTVPEIR